MAHALTQTSLFRTGSTMDYPVIIKGQQGIHYYLMRMKIVTTAQCFIGALVSCPTTSVTTVEYAGDGEIPIGIIPDTPFNIKQVQKSNSGSALTKALTFTTGYLDVDVAVLLPGCIVSCLVAASNDLDISIAANSNLEVAGAGTVKKFANGPVIGKAPCTTHLGPAPTGWRSCGRGGLRVLIRRLGEQSWYTTT